MKGDWKMYFVIALIFAAGITLHLFVASISGAVPNAPSSPSPADSATNVSVESVLSWTCTDPDNDTLTYNIEFYREGHRWSPSEYVSLNQSSTSWNPRLLFYNSSYLWRVTACDGEGCNTSAWWGFDTDDGSTHLIVDPGYDEYYEHAFNTTNFSFYAIYNETTAVYNDVLPSGLFYLFMFGLVFGGIWIS